VNASESGESGLRGVSFFLLAFLPFTAGLQDLFNGGEVRALLLWVIFLREFLFFFSPDWRGRIERGGVFPFFFP